MKTFRIVQLQKNGVSMLKRFLDDSNYYEVDDTNHRSAVKTIIPILIDLENLKLLSFMSCDKDACVEFVILCTDQIEPSECFLCEVNIHTHDYTLVSTKYGIKELSDDR